MASSSGPAKPAVGLEAGTVLRAKVAFLGDAAVGKTALVQMWRSEGTAFPKNYKMTAGVDLVVLSRQDAPYVHELYLYDTGGAAVFEAEALDYAAGANMVVLVYDITSRESFQSCKKWLRAATKGRWYEGRLSGCLVGNKADLRARQAVDSSVAEEWAEEHGLRYFETSALPEEKAWAAPLAHLENNLRRLYEDHVKRTDELVREHFNLK